MAIPYKSFTRFLQNVWRSSSENLNPEKCVTATLGGNLATVYFFHSRRIDALRLPRTTQSTDRYFAAYMVLLRLGASPIDPEGSSI